MTGKVHGILQLLGKQPRLNLLSSNMQNVLALCFQWRFFLPVSNESSFLTPWGVTSLLRQGWKAAASLDLCNFDEMRVVL